MKLNCFGNRYGIISIFSLNNHMKQFLPHTPCQELNGFHNQHFIIRNIFLNNVMANKKKLFTLQKNVKQGKQHGMNFIMIRYRCSKHYKGSKCNKVIELLHM